jgi:hypothetical protein
MRILDADGSKTAFVDQQGKFEFFAMTRGFLPSHSESPV